MQEHGGERSGVIVPTPKQQRAQRNRSVALAIALGLFVLIVYIGTLARMSGGA